MSYGVICLLCLPLLAIWTSPKSNASMVNWLTDCRLDLEYMIAWRVWIKLSINQKKLLQAWLCACLCTRQANYIITLWWHTIGFCYFCQLVSIACILLYESVTIIISWWNSCSCCAFVKACPVCSMRATPPRHLHHWCFIWDWLSRPYYGIAERTERHFLL